MFSTGSGRRESYTSGSVLSTEAPRKSLVSVEERSTFKSSWHFVVSETNRHQRGHTVYKVTLQIVPVDVSLAVREVIWWKRYTDFAQLHKQLFSLHAALFLKGQFPAFPKAQLIGRHEEGVVESRRSASEKLLNFVSNYPILLRHQVFQDFIQGGESCEHSVADYDPTVPLRPHSLLIGSLDKPDPQSADQDDLINFTDSKDDDTGHVTSPITGIWHHRLADAEDLGPEEERLEIQEGQCCTDQESLHLAEDLLEGSCDDADDAMKAGSLPTARYMAALLGPDDNQSHVAGDSNAASPSCEKQSNALEEDYLFVAGHHLARANDKELAADYEAAFGLYKLGIDLLLKGVQTDADAVRRDAVRRKAAKYLNKAEQLYMDHIAHATSLAIDTLELTVQSEHAGLSGAACELSQYTVIKMVASGIVLVMNKQKQETFIMKIMAKCANLSKQYEQRTIIPVGVAQMVQLHRFIHTEDAVYLILQHAKGGKLWNYMCSALPTAASTDSALSKDGEAEKGSADWRKLVRHLQIEGSRSQSESSDPGAPEDPYSALFRKYTRPSFSGQTSLIMTSQDSGSEHESHADRNDLVWISPEAEAPPIPTSDPDADFLEDLEDVSTSVKALSHWNRVSTLESDQLIAKSRELLQSVDRTLSGPETGKNSRSVSPAAVRPETSLTVKENESIAVAQDDSVEAMQTEEDVPEKDDRVERRLSKRRRFPESVIRVWMGEIILGLEQLHERGLVCQHLSMDNLLLGHKGHILLSYFGQWNCVRRDTWETCADGPSCCHLAPEVHRVSGASTAGSPSRGAPKRGRTLFTTPEAISDSWSLGVIFLQLLTGQPVEACSNLARVATSQHINLRLNATELSLEAEDLLRKLLKFSARERLSITEAKQHPFFQPINWSQLARSYSNP